MCRIIEQKAQGWLSGGGELPLCKLLKFLWLLDYYQRQSNWKKYKQVHVSDMHTPTHTKFMIFIYCTVQNCLNRFSQAYFKIYIYNMIVFNLYKTVYPTYIRDYVLSGSVCSWTSQVTNCNKSSNHPDQMKHKKGVLLVTWKH